jgi:hypothetical protein
MNDDFAEEELMAYADGELEPARAAELAALLAKRPDLARRVDMFARTRTSAAAGVKAHLDRPVPAKLKASIEDMVRHASQRDSAEQVIPFEPRKKPAPVALGNWIAPIAACIVALVSGAIGYWLATQTAGQSGSYQIAGLADPELDQLLSKLPSGEKSRLAGSGAEISIMSSFYRSDQALCREFAVAHGGFGDHLAVACRSSGKWSIDLALRTSGGSGDTYKPASSAETLDAFLHALGAGPALEGQAETDALSKRK